MHKQIVLFCLFLFASAIAAAQDLSAFEKRWLVQGGDTLPYRVLLPAGYDTLKKYPVLFFLHGAGERGRDNEKQLTHGARLFLQEKMRKEHPAIIIFPQCSSGSYWSNVLRLHDAAGKRVFSFLPDGEPTAFMRLLQELVKYVLRTYPVNEKQVYAGGLSMGGMGTYELVRRMPGVFAAAIAICGGAHPETAGQLKKVAWWIFHGGKDDVVPPQASQVIADALRKKHADVKFTVYPTANHNSWDPAFAEKELIPWLFSKRKK